MIVFVVAIVDHYGYGEEEDPTISPGDNTTMTITLSDTNVIF